MEFMTGVRPVETLEMDQLLSEDMAGKTVKVNGTVHSVNDMGAVAFVILRKRDGLLQCVYQEKDADFDLKLLREGTTL